MRSVRSIRACASGDSSRSLPASGGTVRPMRGSSPKRSRAPASRIPRGSLGSRAHVLSGGEARRVLFALALLRRPRLLLVDEPEAGLDPTSRDALADGLRALAVELASDADGGQGSLATSLVLSSHDREFVARVGIERTLAFPGARPGPVEDAAAGPRSTAPSRTARDSAADRRAVLVCERLGVARGRAAVRIVHGASLEVAAGEVVVVRGPSGCGKTTLCRAIAGLERIVSGRIERPSPPRTQLVFQDAGGSLTPHRSVRALCREGAASGVDVDELAAKLDLASALLDRPAFALSGGEQRRVALLRALTPLPTLLLLDEPTVSLDADRARRVAELVRAEADRRGCAVLITSHERGVLDAIADRVLDYGEIDPSGEPEGDA
jgi:peptide/nickel transport system ATP-binding protein